MDFSGFHRPLPGAATTGTAVGPMGGGFQPQQAQKQQGRGGFATSLISEAGGMGGALGGAALGTAILPGVGTLLGAGIGGFLGGFGGRVAENEVRDGRAGFGDALTEGAISGISGAGPIRGGKALVQGGKSLLKGGAKASLEDAVTEAATKAPLKTSIRGKMSQTGTNMLTSQYPTLTAPMARATDLKGTVAKLSDIGIVKPEDAERIASEVTGAGGIINKAVLTATGGAGRVPIKNVQSVATQAVNDIGLVDSDAKSVMTIVNAQMKRLGNGSDAEPGKVLQVMKSLESRIADLKGKGGNAKLTDPVREDKAKALMAVRNELQDKLYTSAGANKNLGAVLTPELRDKLVALHPNVPQWQNHVDNVIMKSSDVGSLRSAMAPFVNITKAIDAGDINSVTAGGRFGNAIKNGAGIGNILASGAMDVAADPVSRVVGQGLRKAGGAVPTIAGTAGIKGPAAGVPGMIGRELTGNAIGAATGMKSPMEASAMSTGMPDQSQMQGDTGQSFGQQGMGNMGGMAQSDPFGQGAEQSNPYSKENLIYDMQRDPKNAAKYLEYYKQLDEIYAPANKAQKLNGTQIQQQNTAQSGIDSLNMIGQTLQQSPGTARLAALPGGSFTQKLTGTGAYSAATANAVDAIGRLRSGGAINADEEKRFKTLLPAAFDDEATVKYKLTALNNIFQRFANPQQSGGLEDSLMAAQSQGGYQ